MEKITAPYGFVPLANKVVTPDWLQFRDSEGRLVAPPVHDIPFQDGLCGTLELEIEAETPIFVRGADKSGEKPFQLANGKYAIPGTSLRGALRNIIEIITFSRFKRVNDHRYAVRDLNNRHLYGQYMADIVKDSRTGKGEPMPLVNAGWLRRKGKGDDADYRIEVCDFAKFEYRDLMNLADERGVRNFKPGEKQSSVDKYNHWKGARLENVEVKVQWKRPPAVGNRKMVSQFGLAKPAAPSQTKGTLVMTGQPSRWVPDQVGRRAGSGSAKHHDFLFFPTQQQQQPLLVPIQVFQDFEFAHSDRGQQNNLGKSQTPNAEWAYWEDKMEKGQPVPVFFLSDPEGKRVASFGLAMMFRLPYNNSIHEAVHNVSREHIANEGALDFAEGLFGTVRDSKKPARDDGALALKGRVGISHAQAIGAPSPQKAVQAVLGSPKASYYPNYVEQMPGTYGGQPTQDHKGNAVYQTWMDNGGAPRGWKRYRTLTQTHVPAPPSGADGRPLDLAKVGTRFTPLPPGTKFRAHVDLHNLKPEELGALLWAVEFGGDDKARHTLGMARPLGFGRSKVSIVGQNVCDMGGQRADLNAARAAFQAWMETRIPGWSKSAQVLELLALAQPVKPEEARYQRLDPGKRENEFIDAKKAGLALPPAVTHGKAPISAAALAPAGTAGGVIELRPGARVNATVLAKTTKKGGPMFGLAGTDKEGILHPSSQVPASLNEGEQYVFEIMATGASPSLKWINPDAPPPPPPKKPAGPPHRKGPGFRR